ncbi:hypothetical protein LWI28_015478 [Acer negundo]|uniref:Uncharacterized protein n=1 Tax=Acer negundo TaxID=4023 RepID=A0AAD5IQA0_ACENE|nr:hypothetical protein LWI28_015478 [Acer negundo]
MRIKKHHQMIHCLFQLGQLQGPRGSKKYLMGADSELLKSKFGPHEEQIWTELRGPLQRASEVGLSTIIYFQKAHDDHYRCYEHSILQNRSQRAQIQLSILLRVRNKQGLKKKSDDVPEKIDFTFLVARGAQAKEDDELQRDNVFHTQCHVNDKDIDEVSQAINNIMVKIRGRFLLKSGGMMRIKKHHQMIHCLFQLDQLHGSRGSKKYLIGADSELLKSKFGPHKDQIRTELHRPL